MDIITNPPLIIMMVHFGHYWSRFADRTAEHEETFRLSKKRPMVH